MAMILQSFVGRYLNQLADFVEGEACMVLGVKDDLSRLQRRLHRLSSVLDDAERKRIEDETIKTWVRELKGVMYDADDIIDLCIAEGSKLLRDHDGHPPESGPASVCSPFPLLFSCFSATNFRHEIGKRIKDLNGRIQEIAEDSSILSRLNTSASRDAAPTAVNTRQTSPLLPKSDDIVGEDIEHATQRLVMSIIKEEEPNNNNCRVFGIVGMGGIGKTTLARKIYNDGRISNMFATRIWVCISQNFNEEHVLQRMIREAGGSYGNATTRSELEPMLASVLSAKKSFFVVLDDVWGADVWENLLKIPLECGAARGRVLVTTRDESIARSMRAISIHRVGKMEDSDGWVLLRKMVFAGDVGEDEVLGFRDVGAQIVRKCDGLPLAIKVIAGVLRSKERRIVEWENLLRSDSWSMSHLPEELRGALYLSYENLPPDLKQCFLSCSLYPEDSVLWREELVRYWVDEGFIRAQRGDGLLMEQVAEDYYKELIARNLLQQVDYADECVMHDLLHSLALFLVRGESVCLDKVDASAANGSSLTELRHMFISNVGEGSMVLNQIKMKKEHACLRTLIIHDSRHLHTLETGLLERLVRLRVLKLHGTGLERLPDSVGKLIHLRQLDLLNTDIEFLPETIGDLVNLQTLILENCPSLRRLPNGIVRLRNLRCLHIVGCPVSRMPKGIGQLKNLNDLAGFTVGSDATSSSSEVVADEGCDITELQSLTQLRFLSIEHLERTTTGWNSSLANNSFLRILELSFSVEGADADTQERILEGVSLPPNLQELTLSGFAGRRFPPWILSPSPSQRNYFHRLEVLDISDCPACLQLPPLAQLPELRILRIVTVPSVASIGREFIGHNSTSAAFPKLETLTFDDMSNWEQWSLVVDEEKSGDGGRLLPCLKALEIVGCPKLRSLPEGLQLATSLKEISIVYAGSLQEIKNLPLTERLRVDNCSGLERLSDFPNLESIEIINCPKLKQVVNLDSLHHIKLTYPSRIAPTESSEPIADPIDQTTERLPDWIGGLVQQCQQKEAQSSAPPRGLVLSMECSSHLLRRCTEGGQDWPIINQIPQVHITTNDESGSSLWYTTTPPSYNYVRGRILED